MHHHRWRIAVICGCLAPQFRHRLTGKIQSRRVSRDPEPIRLRNVGARAPTGRDLCEAPNNLRSDGERSFAETGRFREVWQKKTVFSGAKGTRIVLNEPSEPLLLSHIWQQNYQDKIVQNARK